MKLVLGVVFTILVISLIVGVYYLKRTLNYKLYYEKQVKQTITEMVNQNYLRRKQ